jgi:hypothetical protein
VTAGADADSVPTAATTSIDPLFDGSIDSSANAVAAVTSAESSGEYETLSIANDAPLDDVDDHFATASEADSAWSVTDNYDDYELFQGELEHQASTPIPVPPPALAAAAATTATAAAVALTDDDGDDFGDDGLNEAESFAPDDERRKIRIHQIFNPNYQFGLDDLADTRVYFARANVLSHYVNQQVSIESSVDEAPEQQTQRYHNAWNAAGVASELYASAAICRARMAGCECMAALALPDPSAASRASCVCLEVDRDWAENVLAASQLLSQAPTDETTPNRSHRTPIQMTDIHKEWGALLTAAGRVASYCASSAPESGGTGAAGGGDADDDASEDGKAPAGKAKEPRIGSGNEVIDHELWYMDLPPPGGPAPPPPLPTEPVPDWDNESCVVSPSRDIDRAADAFDTDLNDDVSVPSGLRFVPLESHWFDTFNTVVAVPPSDDASPATTTAESTVGGDQASTSPSQPAPAPVTRHRQRRDGNALANKIKQKVPVELDEFGVPIATPADVLALLRIAVHRLTCGFGLSARQLSSSEAALAELDAEILDAEQRLGPVGGARVTRRRRLRARRSGAQHRHVSLLFCLGDVLCDLARISTGGEFEPLFSCASAHYAGVFRSGLHGALALDYLGATLDTWAREVLSRCATSFQRDSLRSSPNDPDEVPRVSRLSEEPTWADVRRLFVAARERFRLALVEAPEDVVVPVHWGQSLQAEANERRGETAVNLLLACVGHLERAVAARPADGFVLRCLGDARVDVGKAMRRLGGDDDSGLMRCARLEELDNDTTVVEVLRTVRRFSVCDECDTSVTHAELGVPVAFERTRGSLRRQSVALLQAADSAFRAAVVARPTYTVAMNNHGLALSTLAKWTTDARESDMLFQRAYHLFARISEPLTASTYHCQSNFAMTLAAQARILQWRGETIASRRRLRMATAKLRPLLLKGDAWASFCIARVHAVAGRFEQCRLWLTRCRHRNYLGRATPSQLAFFDNVREFEWFDEMLRSARAASEGRVEMSVADSDEEDAVNALLGDEDDNDDDDDDDDNDDDDNDDSNEGDKHK